MFFRFWFQGRVFDAAKLALGVWSLVSQTPTKKVTYCALDLSGQQLSRNQFWPQFNLTKELQSIAEKHGFKVHIYAD